MKSKRVILGLSILAVLTISSCSIFGNSPSQKSKQSIIDSLFSSGDDISESTNSSSKSTSSEKSSSSQSSSSSSSKSSSQSSSSNSSSSQSSSSNSSSSSSSSSSSNSSTTSSSSTSSSSSSSTNPPDDQGGFSGITRFDSPVDIHTAQQKTFLSYSGKYDEMDPSLYPGGTQLLSDSLPVAVSWDYQAPVGKTVSGYDVTYGQKSDLSDGYTISVTNKTANMVNPYLGRNYFRITAKLSDGSKVNSEIRTFDVDDTCPRNLAIGGMTNCRDMGGRVTEDGGKIKQGLVYRTSGFKYDYSTQITEDGKKEMLEHLKVKTEVNVADGTSYNLKLNGTTTVDLKMDYSGGQHHFSRNAESVKQFFNLLADSNNYPVYFHCRIGTDRTGLCANLLYGLLGVPLNQIYQDYLFSNFGKIGEKRYIGAKAGADNIQNYMNQIDAMCGQSFKNRTYNMLLAIGVSKTTLDTVISNLTEGTVAQNNNSGQVVATADKFTASGTTLQTTQATDRSHPDAYYVLNSTSQSVSYTFTASKAYTGQVVAYLGNTDSSTSKKIGDAISCQLDSTNVSIQDITYSAAGMGKCSSRMNYYPVVLGNVDISSGSHTIKINGTSNTMNIGTICIFDTATGSGGSGGGQQGGGEHTHSYQAQTPVTNTAGKTVTTYLCDCGKKYIDIKFTDYTSIDGELGSDGKIGGSSKVKTTFKWDVPAKAGNVTLMFNMKMSYDSHSSQTFDSSKYSVKINGTSQTILLQNGATYSTIGLTTSGQYFAIANYQVLNDMNVEVEFVHNNSDYRLLFTENVRLMYAE